MYKESSKAVSIVMPCYNAAAYIEESIKSVISNSFFLSCELIIVNDGSVDESMNIINKYTNAYENIISISIPNSGVSVARNIGLKSASSKYIAFIDADDLYSEVMLQSLYQNMEVKQLDVCFGLWTDKKEKLCIKTRLSKTITKTEALNYLLYVNKPVGLWTAMYRRDLLINYDILFPENIKYGEDLLFLWNSLIYGDRFAIVEAFYYYYRINNSSAMNISTWNKTEVINVVETIHKQIELHYSVFKEPYEKYMMARTLLSLLKDFAKSSRYDLYLRLENEYDCKVIKECIYKGKLLVRISSLLYLCSSKMFYKIIGKVL